MQDTARDEMDEDDTKHNRLNCVMPTSRPQEHIFYMQQLKTYIVVGHENRAGSTNTNISK